MSSSTQFCTLKPSNSQEILAIMMKSNREVHPMIINKLQSVQEFEENSRGLINHYFQAQENCQKLLCRDVEYLYGMRLDGKLVAVLFSIDAIEKYRTPDLAYTDPTHPYSLFNVLYNKTVDNFPGLQVGTATYQARLNVLPEAQKYGLGTKLMCEGAKYLLSRGYQFSFGITFVENALRLFKKIGAEVLKSEDYDSPTFKFTYNIIKYDFPKVVEIYEKMQEQQTKSKK